MATASTRQPCPVNNAKGNPAWGTNDSQLQAADAVNVGPCLVCTPPPNNFRTLNQKLFEGAQEW